MSLLDENKEIKDLLNNLLDQIVHLEEIEALNRRPPIDNQDPAIIPNYHCAFNVSEVAIVIGENPHVSTTKALYEYLIKIPSFKRIIDRKNFQQNLNKEDKFVKNLIKTFEIPLKQIVSELIQKRLEDMDEVNNFINSKIMNLSYIIPEDIRTEKLISIIESQFKSEINKFRGIILEPKSLNEIESEKNIKITNRNTEKIEEWSRNKFYKLIGKVDGISIVNHEKCVIEVKNRMIKRDSLPIYDYIQCILYMKLTKTKKCYLYECYSDGSKKETLIEWNQEVYKNIDIKLTEFVNLIRQIRLEDINILIKKHQNEYVLE